MFRHFLALVYYRGSGRVKQKIKKRRDWREDSRKFCDPDRRQGSTWRRISSSIYISRTRDIAFPIHERSSRMTRFDDLGMRIWNYDNRRCGCTAVLHNFITWTLSAWQAANRPVPPHRLLVLRRPSWSPTSCAVPSTSDSVLCLWRIPAQLIFGKLFLKCMNFLLVCGEK